MAGEWHEISLGNVCSKIGSGATPRGGKEAYRGGATALIRSQNIYNDRFVRSGLAFIDDTQADDLRNVVVEEGDVLLNITGDSVARCCQVAADVLPARVNQHVAIIRPEPDVLDAKFLRYSLVSPAMQAHLLGLASAGATRNALTKAMIESLSISAPPIEEQRAIAHILGTLDDKIELNRRMNQTLEDMARALFKSWFVDFDGVAPEDMQQSELGLIPKGWRVSTIGQEVAVLGGSTPSTKDAEFWNDGIHHWATPKDLSSLAFPVLLDTERKITDAGLAKITSGLLPAGTLLLSSRAPIGYLAIAEVPTAINQGFIAMKCDSVLSNIFMLHWCRENMDAIIGNANGSTFLEISKSNFRPLRIIVPATEVLRSFEQQAEPLHESIVANERESQALTQLRGSLLPNLISGELSITDFESLVIE